MILQAVVNSWRLFPIYFITVPKIDSMIAQKVHQGSSSAFKPTPSVRSFSCRLSYISSTIMSRVLIVYFNTPEESFPSFLNSQLLWQSSSSHFIAWKLLSSWCLHGCYTAESVSKPGHHFRQQTFTSKFHDLNSGREQIVLEWGVWGPEDQTSPLFLLSCTHTQKEIQGQERKIYWTSEVDNPPPLVNFHRNHSILPNVIIYHLPSLYFSCTSSLFFRMCFFTL